MAQQDFILADEGALAEIVEPLLLWYRRNARDLPWRHTNDPYKIWVSEIMLQQTRVNTVISYYNRFLAELPTVEDLASAPEEKLLKLWEGLGYYSRVRNMQKAAGQIAESGYFPNTMPEILKLSGIGNYTAGAILSIAFDKPEPAVDGNVLRVITRITANSGNATTESFKKQVAAALREIYPKTGCGNFTASLMELGATVCVPNGRPLCESCPLYKLCRARALDKIANYPVLPPKRQKKTEELTVFILKSENDRVALNMRQNTGLLKGMPQLPNVPGKLTLEGATDWLYKNGFEGGTPVKSFHEKHIFTHIRWEMQCYEFNVAETSTEFIWATAGELENRFSMPTAFKKLLEHGL